MYEPSEIAAKRKNQHLDLCENQDIEAKGKFTGFSEFSLLPCALSELESLDVSMERRFLGRVFSLPLLITGMTGGVDKATKINEHLAAAALRYNIPMGVGSQRMALESPDEFASIFRLKDRFPGLFLIGNVGYSQINHGDAVQVCEQAVKMIDADALAIHLNVMQELIQPEGESRAKGFFGRLQTVCAQLQVPVMVKEVGCGIGPDIAEKLISCGVAAIDVGGRGGTSWPYIEGLRNEDDLYRRLGDTFRDWGIPTAYALRAVRKEFKEIPLIATGGIRDGLTVAKACGLGATMVGVGLPLMKAALISEEKVCEELEFFKKSLLFTMLASDCSNIDDLCSKMIRGEPYQYEPFLK